MTTNIIEMTPAHLSDTLAAIQGLDYDDFLDLDWLRYRTLDDPCCSPELLLLAVVEGEIVGFCFGRIREGKGSIKLFGVSKAYRRRGVATALFDEIESRFGARGIGKVTVGAMGPNYFAPGVELQYTDAISFLMHRGYATERTSRVDMAVDLQHTDPDTREVEKRLAEEGMVLRRAEPGDIEATAELALTYFSTGWHYEVSETARFDPPPLFIALDNGRVVGFAAYDVTGRSRFGPTGTRPDYRRRGIGAALLKMCLRSMRDRGDNRAEISWAGPLGFYARAVDARIHKAYWVFHKSL